MIFWFQAAYDTSDEKRPWVVLRCYQGVEAGMTSMVIARYPTRHEAEGHTKKYWERSGR